jgi:GNAT superfamily N-acetyltransferase
MPDSAIQNIKVRPATPETADFVLALVPQLAAFGPPPWRSVQQMIETDTLVIDRALRGLADRAVVLVAEDGTGKPLGFVHVCGDGDYYTRRECGHIADIVVAREARGHGVGEALLAAAEQWARDQGYSMLTLNVFIENTQARALYDRTGFCQETIRYVKPLR